ncbi:Serine threonine-kinase HAL4 SAT4 [Hyphodiscus hymeniophilus]|uniref:Serine threonine-kinase HAL4 SAT4 n=1 Tax=Hyphodiscus hymeniophilus TaxID=353542 RepID=A0A9P6SPW4_9HELO|nr:Serine threonine-kinase HAL4 SAT4 [Hyphodiscus hymeniophilus]
MATSQSLPSPVKHVFYDENNPEDLHTYSSSTSHASSPESRPVDIASPIPEEEEDETGSEAANEPLTPTDSHHPPPIFQDKMNGNTPVAYGALHTQTPLILNTSPTPPPSAGKDIGTPAAESPKTPIQKRPTTTSRESTSGLKKVMSGLFKRTNSNTANLQPLTTTESAVLHGSDPMLGKEYRRMSTRRMSTNTSPATTRSNTPPSPSSLADFEEKHPRARLQVQEPSENEFFSSRRKIRSSTGFSLRDRLHKHSKVSFTPDDKDADQDHPRHRATSVDLDGPQKPQDGSQVQTISRQVWGMAAETGSGLKSRRMSLSLPDDFTVDVVELYNEYADQSKLLGRRGKSVGKGATANVKLMNRKGGSAGEVYAVKEFRGKSSNEKAEDYEKKVKSEYSIAKSVHHPNIVETFRLCTHNGRWNHVMEFCDQGDLFSLVNLKYLAKDDHQVDRLCLFKQLIQGLNYLHSNGIAHRDVKLENLLITKDSKLKITDFGVSEVFAGIHPGLRSAGGQCGKEMQEVRLCAPGICGSPPYIAPEVVAKNGEYDPRPLDVWGAAIVMLCMCANGCLWERAVPGSSALYDDLVRGWQIWNSKHTPTQEISESDYPHVSFFDNHINPPALRRVLLTMLNPDPAKRVTMAQVANNRWLKKVECCQIDSYDDPAVMIDASKLKMCEGMAKVKQHNHLPPHQHGGHKFVRLPGSTHM